VPQCHSPGVPGALQGGEEGAAQAAPRSHPPRWVQAQQAAQQGLKLLAGGHGLIPAPTQRVCPVSATATATASTVVAAAPTIAPRSEHCSVAHMSQRMQILHRSRGFLAELALPIPVRWTVKELLHNRRPLQHAVGEVAK